MSWKSEKVLDVEVLSKHCQACATHHEMNTSSDELLDWWEGQQASYEVNYCGSSSVMESTGAFAIWKRSVSKNMLRYTQMISDGDSKIFKFLSDQLPMVCPTWWASMNVWGMCKKRMGTALREKAKEKFVTERGERVRMRWKGRITDKTIKLLTRYYGKAIRSSTGVCAAMQDAAWEVFYHSQSSVPVLPQWPVVLVQVQLGTCQFRAIPTPLTHHPSRHCSSSQKYL